MDVAVIGAGTAGLAAYRAARAAGRRAVLIEAGPYGTTCARVGCMPSKLLIAAADVAHAARHGARFGVDAAVAVDGARVMERVRRERDRFVGFVVEGVDAIPADDRLRGRATFVAPGALDVDGLRVTARSVVVATGSSPVVGDLFAPVRARVDTSDDVFEWRALPSSVAVFGAGVIGLELGVALARLGVRVRIFGRGGAVGPLRDPVVREAARAAIADEVPLLVDADVRDLRLVEGGAAVRFVDGGAEREETFERVLVAAGRRPNVDGLGLERAGVTLDDRGRPRVDRETMQAGTLPVFLAGDAAGDAPLLHEAADEGRIAGESAARFPEVTRGRRRSLLSIAFTSPQLAVVGASYAALAPLRDAGEVVIGEVSFDDQGRSRVMGENRGHLRVYAARDGRLLGAELAGPRAEHLGHLLAWSHQAGLTVGQMLEMPFYHPVVEEGLRTALRDAARQLSP
ncbi:MAG: dihydrolipoyl dehydrogenase [Polyangiaceae bacterium]|nr:dihydrolipoyl dehydrogenase [Polyangiaceae bacterium]